MTKLLLNREEQLALQITTDLNKPYGLGITAGMKTRLHSGQIEVLQDLYKHGKKIIMLPCGRKFAKTESAAYVLWKQALNHPGSACYYVTPQGSHGREIVWNNNRLQKFLGKDSKKYINQPRNQEMLIPFKNGSYIRVIGSENYGVANGLTPDIAVYDEFKLFHPRWHTDFSPNLSIKAAPLLIIGTLPTPGDSNYEQYYEVLDAVKSHPKGAVHFKTTWDNPINQLPDIKEGIERDIEMLRLRGEEDVVQREYYSKIIPGGKRAVFPMLQRERHVVPHATILAEIDRDRKRLEFVWCADPGNTTAFGMLFACLNRYTGKLYILDEIYEKNQNDTSCGVIIPRGKSKCFELQPGGNLEDDWLKISDEAAAWFMTESMQRYGIYFSPAEKWKGTKEEGLSLIKDQLIHGAAVISDRCENLLREMEMYAKDGSGKIPKKNDHLIDCFRYLNMGLRYDFNTIAEYVKNPDPIEAMRFRNMRYAKDDEDEYDSIEVDDFDLDEWW